MQWKQNKKKKKRVTCFWKIYFLSPNRRDLLKFAHQQHNIYKYIWNTLISVFHWYFHHSLLRYRDFLIRFVIPIYFTIYVYFSEAKNLFLKFVLFILQKTWTFLVLYTLLLTEDRWSMKQMFTSCLMNKCRNNKQ